MDASAASHPGAAAIAKAAAEQSAATAATLAAAWPSPSAAALAAMAAPHAAAMSATAARVVASSEATIPSMPRLSACQARSEAAAAVAADLAALAESRPELAMYFMSLDLEADLMLLSPSESNKAVSADNLDEPSWGDFLDGCEFEALEDDYTVTSEYCGPSDSDLEYFGFCRKNLNDPHCDMETSQIVSHLSEISLEDRLNQDSERQLTVCSMGASTYCFK